MNIGQNPSVIRIKVLLGLLAICVLLPTTVSGNAQDKIPAETPTSSTLLNTLSEPERTWLRAHPVIRVAQDPGWPPIEFTDDHGTPAGMTADYLRLVEERLGVQFQQVNNLSWQEAYARMTRWEIDLTTSVAVTSDRETFWAFTKPYMTIPLVIVTRSDVAYIADLRELEGIKVVVVAGYAAETWIARDFPKIQLVTARTVQEALSMLQRGEAFACVENMLVVDQFITKLKMSGLKITGSTPYNNAQCMAVRKDWAILAGILDKTLDSISATERNVIYRKWLSLKYPSTFDYTRLWPVAAILAVVLIGLVAWNWRLSAEIRHRQKAEAALRISEERFRRAVVDSPFPILLHAEDGTIIQASNSWCEITGYSHEELATIGDWTERAYGERKAMVQADIDALYGMDRRKYEGDYTIRAKSGGTRIWEFSSAPLDSLPDGRRLVISMAMDVTERRLTEQSLQESERRLAEAQKMAQLGHWSWDMRTGRVEWSDEVYRIFRLDPETFIPCIDSILEMSPWPEDHERDKELIRKAMESHEKGSYEQRILRPDKSVGYYQSTFQGRYGDQGELVSIVGTVLDITGRKLAEEALRRYAERLKNLHKIDQAILQAIESPEMIVQTALQHLCALLHCERASVGIFELEQKQVRVFAAEVNGKRIVQTGIDLAEEAYGDLAILRQGNMEIVEDMSKVPSPPAAARILQVKGVSASINVPLLSVHGLYGALNIGWEEARPITVEEREIAGEAAGQITIAIEQAHLLQETKRYAVELEQRVADRTAQLEAANKELEAFSYSVSHDLRAPLRAIDGYDRILLEDYAGRLDDEGRRVLGVISSETHRMGQLVDDLLAFSRLGRQKQAFSEIDMTALSQEAFGEQAALAPKRTLQLKLEPLSPARGDRAMLRVVLVNLLSNAIKFTQSRDPSVIEVGSRRENGQTVYFVKDNGVGFDMRYASKLFGVFQRLHSAEEFEGTGVGLALVQRIVHRHGGRVWFEAKVNEGATLFFSLPDMKG